MEYGQVDTKGGLYKFIQSELMWWNIYRYGLAILGVLALLILLQMAVVALGGWLIVVSYVL